MLQVATKLRLAGKGKKSCFFFLRKIENSIYFASPDYEKKNKKGVTISGPTFFHLSSTSVQLS